MAISTAISKKPKKMALMGNENLVKSVYEIVYKLEME
jgi:hypothetical protein